MTGRPMARTMVRVGLRVLAASTAIAVAVSHAHAQPKPAAATLGFSPARLARIDTLLDAAVSREEIAGAVVLVLRDDQVVYERAAGWRDREAKRPMTPDAIFRIASQSKALTSVATLMLMEEGKFLPSTPVSRFLPTFARTTVAVRRDTGVAIVPAARPITIRHLLTHTAGISYGTESLVAERYRAKGLGPAQGPGWYTADKAEPICTTMDTLGTLPFVAQPGEAWVYGYNTDILGCVVERASGTPLDRFIAERITGPLGMHDTHFYLPPADRERLVTVYASRDGKTAPSTDPHTGQGAYVDGPRVSFAGGAGLLSTARDYARFLQMIAHHGSWAGKQYLAPHSVALMRTNQVGALHAQASGPGLGFGFGFETVDSYGAGNLSSEGSFDWGGAYGSKYRVDPIEGLTIVVMINQLPIGTDLVDRVQYLTYAALTKSRRR